MLTAPLTFAIHCQETRSRSITKNRSYFFVHADDMRDGSITLVNDAAGFVCKRSRYNIGGHHTTGWIVAIEL